MADVRTIIIDGFAFHSRKEAQAAQKEAEGVAYLKERMLGQDPMKVLEFYHKMIDEEIFETVVGISFEKEIHDKLLQTPGISPDMVRPIDLPLLREEATKEESKIIPTNEKKTQKMSTVQFISIVLNIVLALLVVGMFYLAKSGDNINILNYENELINKYEAWEMELADREAEISLREAELAE